MASINKNVEYDSSVNKSFCVLRTNPKFTGNSKLIVDSNNEIYLGSFPVNAELSQTYYQKYPIKSDGIYSNDLSSFFRDLPSGDFYDVGRIADNVRVYGEYSFQYEDIYQYGASYNSTKLYDEQYKMLAPLWLERKMPKKFIIYRVDRTKHGESAAVYTDDINGQNERVLDMLRNATIIKTYDLVDSKVGNYLTTHLRDINFPKSSITFNFNFEDSCEFHGISINSGGLVTKREYVNEDFIKRDNIEIENNEFITNAFERNNIVSANLINLEFMFDDPSASNYDIYRYFGIYADDIKEGTFEPDYIDPNGLRVKTETIKTVYDETIATNPSWLNNSIVSADMIPSNEDLTLPMLNYIKDKHDKFHHVKGNITLPNKLDVGPITLSDFTGKDITNENLTAINPETSMKGFIKFKINSNPNNLDRLFVASKSEIESEGYNLNDLTASADNSLAAGDYLNNTFSGLGTTTEIAVALLGAISHIIEEDYGKDLYKVTRDGDSIIIEDYATNTVSNKFGIGIFNFNVIDFITIESATTNNMGLSGIISGTDFDQWTKYTPRGGANKDNCFFVRTSDIGPVTSANAIKEVNTQTYANILDIVVDPFLVGFSRVIYDTVIKTATDNVIKVYEYYQTEFGKFSAYDIKDFNFDFYDTSNSSIGDLSYEKSYEQTYPGTNNLWASTTSYEIGDFIFNTQNPIDVYQVSSFTGINGVSGGVAPTGTTNQVNGTLNLIYIGVGGASTISSIDESSVDYWKKLTTILELDSDEDISINRIKSEYDRLKENTLKETSTLSRDVPYIMKFALKEGHNSRRLPYMLSTSEAFGLDNLSSNITRKEREPYHLAMEYFDFVQFQSNHPALLASPTSTYIKSYLDFAGGGGSYLTEQLLKDTSYDYFSKYFNWCGYLNTTSGNWVDDDTYRIYSLFENGDNTKPPSTVYRGLRYILKNRKEFTSISPRGFSSSSRLNRYKFGNVFLYSNEDPWAINTAYSIGDRASSNGKSYRCIVSGTSGSNASIHDPNVSSGEFEDPGSPSSPKLKWEYVGLEGNSKSIRVIKNDVFKFVCVLIEVCTIDNEITDMYRNTLYRENDINKPWTSPSHVAVDVPVTSYFDFLNLPDYSANSVILEVSSYTIANNEENLLNEVTQLNDGTYSVIEFTNPGTGHVYQIYIDSILSSTQLQISNIYNVTTSSNVPIATINGLPDLNLNYNFKYIKGGELGFKRLLDDLTASGIANQFNTYDENIKYISVDLAGSYMNRFTLDVEDGQDFVKPSFIKAVNDNDRPKSYMLGAESIGNKIGRKPFAYYTQLRRFNGDYNPIFTDVVTFTDSFNRHKLEWATPYTLSESRKRLIYDKFNGEGFTFASHKKIFKEYGKIKNYFYHKVNDENTDSILKLSEATDKQPLYPLIGEIGIGKKEINVFDSKYMSTYFSKSTNAKNTISVHGTLSPVEKKSFMASTVMKVRDVYDLLSHTVSQEKSIDILDEIKDDERNTTDIHWFQDDKRIYIDFYAPSSIINKLKADGIASKFTNYVDAINSFGDKTTLDDDLEIYIKSNIVNRFIIDSIDVYAIEGKNIQTGITSVSSTSDLIANQYQIQSNYEIHSSMKEGMSFRLIYNRKLGYYYDFKIHVKIQA